MNLAVDVYDANKDKSRCLRWPYHLQSGATMRPTISPVHKKCSNLLRLLMINESFQFGAFYYLSSGVQLRSNFNRKYLEMSAIRSCSQVDKPLRFEWHYDLSYKTVALILS